MAQEQYIHQTSKKGLIKRILLGLAIVVMAGGVTVIALKLLYKAPVAKNTTPAKVLTPTELIAKYKDDYKLNGYALNDAASDSIIPYKPAGSAYTVQVNAKDSVQFTRPDNSSTADIARATNDSKTYLTNNGFTAVKDQIATDSTQQVFESQSAVCKLSNSFNPNKNTSAYGIACADKKQFTAERDTTETLLKLNAQAGTSDDMKSVSRTIITQDNKSLNLLSVNPQNASTAPYTLIYAAIDGKWEYIGKRTTPSIDVKDSFTLSPALKTAINNPKYGGFIAKYIY